VLLAALAAASLWTAAGFGAARKTPAPKVGPIVADFRQDDFATYYSIDATPAPGEKLTFYWHLQPPSVDPKCNSFRQSATAEDHAVWKHGDEDGCDHAKMGPRGHRGVVTVTISQGSWVCRASYSGTISGTGDAAECTEPRIVNTEGLMRVAILDEKEAADALAKSDKGTFTHFLKAAIFHLDGIDRTLKAHKGTNADAKELRSDLDTALALDKSALDAPETTAKSDLEKAQAAKEAGLKLIPGALG
jgi:hypothetical protein